eukprot:TRINITY_DN15476_c0_g1_i1.p1 TRINITY_DN15476_c0_g1~~TRINITY_DN15476_c0_g1_i1.p1  ORF type:complete len:692 (-),score=168.23 TRINITY_DN15476_c0_g1_i1:4-1953(-)
MQTLAQELKNLGTSRCDEIGSLKAGEHTWENTVLRFVHTEAEIDTQSTSISFPSSCSPDKDVRDSSNKLKKELQDFKIDLYNREDVFLALSAFHSNPDNLKELAPVDIRLLEKLLSDFKRNGLGLPKEKRERFTEIQKRSNELKVTASRNMNEENSKYLFTREELEGMPESFFSSREKEGDKYVVTLKYPDYVPLMKHCKVAETRQKMEFGFSNRCTAENLPILKELIELRREAAHLLGFKDHASFVLDERMAKTPDAVRDFLNDLREKMEPLANKDLETLQRLKKADLEKRGQAENDLVIRAWDSSYYQNQLLEQEFEVDELKIAEYFPLNVVMKGLLEIYQEILGLVFTQEEEANAWYSDVQLYSVTDAETGEFVGQFYLDLHPRDGKYGHAAVWGLQQGYYRADGSWQYPIAGMLCNFSKPTDDKPSLLRHSEVVTFFHEAGHVFHQLCTKAKYKRFSGTSVERDFVEAPSQMLENWCWQKESITKMSGHYQTGEPIPDELIAKMVAAKLSCVGLLTDRQIFFGLYDQHIHTAEDVADVAELYGDMRTKITKIPNTPGTCGAACWGHIFGGYDASYYGYLWSEVFSCDMFSLFEESSVFDKELGKRYRKVILEQGGTKDGGDLVREFLGRDPNNKAFLKDKGLHIE